MKADWDTPEVNEQIEAVIRRLSLAEKIELVSGNLVIEKMGEKTRPPEGIPLFVLADGPAGVRIFGEKDKPGKSTNLPAPIALAATWDLELARQYGDLIGREMVATGHNVLLGPAVDIARAPLGGRTFESFGEDPLLQARMVAVEIPAIQAHGIQACIKHYLVNNQEYQRTSVDVQVDERTLQEIYLPPFAAAVQQGQVASIMGSYNKINGVYACENASTLTMILREQLRFRGWVMSDFMATPSTAAAANAGLEWELGDERWGEKLLAAVQSGEVTEAHLDEMVRRILRPTYGLGLHKRQREIRPFPIHEHGAKARAIAEQSIVLLKNEGNLLPLSANIVRSIAIIGPDADNISAAGGGSAAVRPTYGVSVLDGIRQRVGDKVQVSYAPGVDPIGAGVLLPGLPVVPSDYFLPSEGNQEIYGIQAEYWANLDFAGEPDLVRDEPRIELNQGFFDIMPGLSVASPKLPPAPMDSGINGRLSARWTGNLTVPISGEYTFSLTVQGTARLYLNDRLVIDTTIAQPVASSNPRVLSNSVPDEWDACALNVYHTAVIRLVANQQVAVKVEYAANAQEVWPLPQAMLRFGWQLPTDVVTPMMETAAALAQQSDVAIVVVRTFESEEMDRPDLHLPNGQNELIRVVTAVNPRTIVVIMSGAPVETASWEDSVPAVIEAWYTGQEQGNAVARILFGDVNPSGKLPLTFPHSEQETPVATQAQYPGVDGVVHYSEGLLVGYRGYDQKGIEPRYPFGHGLSYTNFTYGSLSVTPETSDGKHPIRVTFALTNIGSHTGTEVAQVYLQLPNAAAPQKLVGWARVSLAQGERRQVVIELDPLSWERPFSYWNIQKQHWEIAHGMYKLSVGASSRDIRFSSSFRLVAGA